MLLIMCIVRRVSVCCCVLCSECDLHGGDVCAGWSDIRVDRGGVGLGLRHHGHTAARRSDRSR